MSFQDILKKKRCIITIHNRDELCCARAIVTLKARLEGDSHYNNLRMGRPIQTRLAQQLHREAQVPQRACGLKELEVFQSVLGPEYQLIALEGLKGYIIYKNQAFNKAEHVIALLKIEEHFHAITSLPAFLNRSYFCRHCERAYNEETAAKHNCKGQNCPACKRTQKKCRNFATWEIPTITCPECHRGFYGQACYDAHKSGQKPLCQRLYKCLECCKVYNLKECHVCYKTLCRNCGLYKDLHHPCYIQPYVAKKKKTAQKTTEENLHVENSSDEEEEDLDANPDPLIVAFDIEYAARDIEGSEDKVFEPVLIGWSYLGVANDYHQYKSIPEFLAEMRSRTDVNGKPRQVFCFAHNLRPFDGLIIQEELYR